MLDRKLVGIRVTKERVDRERIFKEHRERFTLVWQVDKHLFVALLSQLPQVCLENFRLGFLDALGDLD
jgi:hypothetical protein